MIGRCFQMTAAVLFCAVVPAHAQPVDSLKGKFAFNGLNKPDREKCIKIDDRLLADFKSSKYRCDLAPTTKTESGLIPQICTERQGTKKKEYLIFESYGACDAERRGQAANG